MRPFKIVIFYLFIILLLLIISSIFPSGYIKINDYSNFKVISFNKIRIKNEVNYKDISAITAYLNYSEIEPSNYFLQLYNFNENYYKIDYDLIKKIELKSPDQKVKTEAQDENKFKQTKTYPFEFPHDDKTILYPFFESLKSLDTSNELIRILHYGDSQIEGDRITSYIRNELQKQFGGYGIGLFPVNIVSEYYMSMELSISKNWKRYTVQDIRNKTIDHKRMGIMMSYSRFSPPQLSNTSEILESTITIQKSDLAYSKAKKFTKCRLFYGFNRKPLIIEVFKNNELFDAEILMPNETIQVNEWNFDEAGTELVIHFKGEDSPDIYAISLDNAKGVAVDNIPLRGSSGIDFTVTDMDFLKEMYDKLNVKLIILQFGVNMVPLMADDYTFYEKKLYAELMQLKNLNPSIPVIVLGVSDMSANNNGKYETYQQIKLICQAQKNAAFNSGCIFWNMYQAMGGENSMPSWVFHKPALATKDFTHFTYTGSKLIAKMFYNSLMNEYNAFINKNQ